MPPPLPAAERRAGACVDEIPDAAGAVADRQDLELSALVYLLSRAALTPDEPGARLVVVRYLERLALQRHTPPLMRRTTRHLAGLWRAEFPAGLGVGLPKGAA